MALWLVWLLVLQRAPLARPARVSAIMQGIDGAPGGDASHPLRDQVAALRRDGRVGIAARPSGSRNPAAHPSDVGTRDRSEGIRPSAPQAVAAPSAERAASPAPSGFRKDSKGTSGERTKRALLQTTASSPEDDGGIASPCSLTEVGNIVAAGEQGGIDVVMTLLSSNPHCAACVLKCKGRPRLDAARCVYGCHHHGGIAQPCNKSEVGGIVAAGDEERVAVFMKLSYSNPLCAACVLPCQGKPGFDGVLCVHGCHHQMENTCSNTTGWGRARPFLNQVNLTSRDSLIRLLAMVLPPSDIPMRPREPFNNG